MEKPGIPGRPDRSGFGLLNRLPGILFIFFLCIFSSQLYAYSGPDEPLEVIVETRPESPVVGTEWKVLMFVDHPRANEVMVIIPSIPEEFMHLDKVLTEPSERLSGDGETWTLVEFSFIPLKAGRILLQPFEIRTPEKSALTSPMSFRVDSDPHERVYRPFLQWESVPQSIEAGKDVEMALLLRDWDPGKKPGSPSHITMDIPEGAVLERLPLEEGDAGKGIVLRLRLIALEPGFLDISPLGFEYAGISLRTASLRLKILPASKTGPAFAAGLPAEEFHYRIPEEAVAPEKKGWSLEPGGHASLFPEFLVKQYREIIRQAEHFKAMDDKARAIAVLRKAERDLAIGSEIRKARLELESQMGLGITEDERRLPVKLLWALFFVNITVSAILALYLAFFRRKKRKREQPGFAEIAGYIFAVILAIAAFCCGIFGTAGLMKSSGKESLGPAVLYETSAYRVPEKNGGIHVQFREGETGIISSCAAGWVYVESSGGKAGWVPADRVIRY